MIAVLGKTHGGEACAANLAVGKSVVILKRALGDRSLVHARVAPEWAATDLVR